MELIKTLRKQRFQFYSGINPHSPEDTWAVAEIKNLVVLHIYPPIVAAKWGSSRFLCRLGGGRQKTSHLPQLHSRQGQGRDSTSRNTSQEPALQLGCPQHIESREPQACVW